MCQWRSHLDPSYRCKVPAEPGSQYCILHEPGTKSIEAFREKLYEQIEGSGPDSERNPSFDFTGYTFPRSDPDKRWYGCLIALEHREDTASASEDPCQARAEHEYRLPREGNVALSFREARIPEAVDISEHLRLGSVDFTDARILGGVALQGEVGGSVHFRSARVEGGVRLRHCRVGGDVDVRDARIESDFDLHHARIGGNVDCWRATIGGRVELVDAEVEGDVCLAETRLRNTSTPRFRGFELSFGLSVAGVAPPRLPLTACLDGARIGGDVDFRHASCRGTVRCRRVRVEGGVRSVCADIGGDIDLRWAKIAGTARFDMARVGGSVSLRDSSIGGHARFTSVAVGKRADFTECTIAGYVDLESAHVGDYAIFRYVQVRGGLGIVLQGSTIGKSVSFRGAEISGRQVNLSYSRVGGNAYLGRASIAGLANIAGATIGGYLSFGSSKIRGCLCRSSRIQGDVYLRLTDLGDKGASFRNAKVMGNVFLSYEDSQPNVDLSEAEVRGSIAVLPAET